MPDVKTFIPDLFLQRAFSSGGEYAWSRDDALAAIAIAERQGLSVSRVDIWLPSSDGAPIIPTPLVYDWDSEACMRHPGSPRSASDFVRTFEWDPLDVNFLNREPHFNFTLDEQQI
jgi:hypothetical protein